MNILFSTLILILLLLPGSGVSANELVKMSEVKKTNNAQIYFTFKDPPRFNTHAENRRLDIQFPDTTLAKDLKSLPADKDLVKILSREFQGQLIVSLFFRYQPQDFKVNPGAPGTIVLDINLGNEYSKSYKDLAKRLKGLNIVDRNTIDFTNPFIRSPYSKNWLSFFSEYEPEVKTEVPVAFTSPPFPIIAMLPPGMEKNMRLLNKEMTDLARQGLWDHLASAVLEKIDETKDIEEQKLLALVYGESLARAGDFEAAYKQLYLLNREYPDEKLAVYAQYLLVLLRAIKENPLTAEYEFRKLEPMIPDKSPIAPYFFLSRIETALASKEYKRLNTLLQKDDIALPANVLNRVRIRQADYWDAIDEPVRSYAAYNLLANSKLLQTQPRSWNNYCHTLYAQRRYQQAENCYQKLGGMLRGKEAAMAAFNRQMSRLHFTSPYKLINSFSEISDNYPETAAAELAELKKNDLLLLQNNKRARTLLPRYQRIGKEGSIRAIRADARFKEILLEKMIGHDQKAIAMAQTFLRDFQSGDIRISAQALLIEMVPETISRQVKEGEYLKALVLARENRSFFEKNWINSKFLVDIADAYQQLGLFDEAQKLYLYLLEVMPIDKREQFYVSLLENALGAGNYSMLDNYASQYAYNYPDGKYADDVLYIRLQGLRAEDRREEAVKMLPSPLPEEARYYRLAGHLEFEMNNYANSLEALQNLEFSEKLTPVEQFMLAECLYRTGGYEQALQTYISLADDHPWHDQIVYRKAQIAKVQGRDSDATDLLQDLAENGENIFWKQLAERELQFNTANEGL